MSIAVLDWAMRNSGAKLADRLVVYSLADHAKSDGTGAWPSVETIATASLLSTRQVQRSLQALEKAGEIRQTGVSKFGTKVFSFPRFIAAMGGDNLSQGVTSDPGGVTNTTENVDQMSPDPSLEPSRTLRPAREAGNVIALRSSEMGSQELIAGYADAVAALGTKAPRRTVGMVAKNVGELLDEGIDPKIVERAIALMVERRLHPSALATLIPEAAAGPRSRTASRYGRGVTTAQILDATRGME